MAENNESSDEEGLIHHSDETETDVIDGILIPTFQKPSCLYDDKTKGPRLIITKIENNFFKSYAKYEVLGPFHKCFNAIVGPNGSGKSNVIDSLLFVFGYRATKIRCKKLSVLIHNSEKYPNMINSCRVTVHFALITDKDLDGYDIVPDSEFIIARTANKDNSSFYELNGKRVQFKEIAVLLKKHGVDLDHNRFLILQGEVEQISMLKPKAEKEGETGMLEYLEDIIGTARYKKPLEQLHERVEILSERRIEKLNRLNLAEKEMNELQQPMEEAINFLKMENTIIRNKNIIIQINIIEFEAKIKSEQDNSAEILNIQKDLETKLRELEEKRKSHAETQNKEVQIYENLKTRKESLKEAYDNVNKKDVQLQADMVNKNNLRKKTKESVNSDKKKLTKLENLPQENEKTIKELEVKINKTTIEKEKCDEEKSAALIKIQTETAGLQQKKAEIQTKLAVLKEAVDKTKSAFNLAETQLKVCVANEENEKSQLEKIKTLCETSESTIQQRSQQIKELKENITIIDKSIKEANIQLLKNKENERSAINIIRSNRTKLEEGKSSMSASTSRGKVLNALMQEKNKGTCPGLFGRLGDLGAIDQKYDVAISTACGPLDNIVVDTVDCAQWCIEFLKKHDIGRAIFIALDKQEHLRHLATSRIQTPENVHRLYDLIKVNDERVRTAFYYSLRDTLVANDLDQASRIAYGARRYRVVTLKGDLIEVTGTMSGGGTRTLRGRMGQSVAVSTTGMNSKDINQLEQELQLAERNLEQLRHDQNELERLIETKNPELNQMQINYQKFTQELQSLKQQQPSLKHQLIAQQKRLGQTKTDVAKVNKLTEIVERTKQEYEEASRNADTLQVQVDAITNDIKKITSDRIGKIDKKLKETTNIIEKCKSEITKLTVEMKTATRNYNTTKENIARMEQDIEEMENSLRAMKEKRLEMEEDAKKLLKCIEEITEQLQEREKTYLDVKKDMEQIVKEVNAIKGEKIDVDAKVKKIQKVLKDYSGSIHSLQSKLKSLKFHKLLNETTEELKSYSNEELAEVNIQVIQKELQQAENHLKAAKPNLNVIQDYEKKREIFVERSNELDEIAQKRREMRELLDKVRQQRTEEFIAGFKIIKLKLKEVYQMITLGGDAELEVIDTYDPFSDGIEFNVRPPKKTWKKISNLSGGEKTLSSLALVFALHYYKPSPLYVLDEIDAALDFKNVSIIGNYIKDRTKNAQFFIISLRSNMIELCDNLTGIYKTFHTTKSITINPKVYNNENNVEKDKENDSAQEQQQNMVMNGNPVSTTSNDGNGSRLENDEQEVDEAFDESFSSREMEIE